MPLLRPFAGAQIVVPVDFERQVVVDGVTDHEVIDATAEVFDVLTVKD